MEKRPCENAKITHTNRGMSKNKSPTHNGTDTVVAAVSKGSKGAMSIFTFYWRSLYNAIFVEYGSFAVRFHPAEAWYAVGLAMR